MNITSVFAGIKLRDSSWLLGVNGSIPWVLSADLQHFKKVTMGGNVIMGRKTWISIPDKFRPLSGRTNIVFSRSELQVPNGVIVVKNVQELLDISSNLSGEFYNIGGAEIYKLLEPYTNKMIVTEVILPYE